jgi:uncharacterized protein YndB with AHSA1/START domain
MIGRSVIHATFSIERTYTAPPPTVFAAFSTEEGKSSWGDTGELEVAEDSDGEASEFDFRVGGRERFTVTSQGTTYCYDARYYDIVLDTRIAYSYEMYADGTRISVSLATIEFAGTGGGTQLTWTEQGAYLDGYNGAEAADLRKGGTAEMLDGLAAYLQRQASGKDF